ncbi:MAG: flagellar motor switch protein FliN [Desulfobulbaceae bacterium]|nr:MAG: flagellar motor switch protein FliN [Desulfobulbaceae bacterium]
MVDEKNANKGAAGDDWTTALTEQKDNSPNFNELKAGRDGQTDNRNLNFLLDVPLEVSVELGRTSMIINKMLHLTQGSVIELNRVAGTPVDIFVNHKLMGKGEVVVINEHFGVRMTEIISQADRIKNIS